MESIAFYGKGGIGKSFIAANMSYHFAKKGKKVLHIGCDPKHDSTFLLTKGDLRILTVLDAIGDKITSSNIPGIINKGKLGIECIESGGPPPGVGCAGRGVARTLEFLQENRIVGSSRYDVVIYDILGDVVCGGFAAPLRLGFAKKVVIVTSEEVMSLYAANNITKAINTYFENGIYLAGLIVNLKDNEANRDILHDFACRINSEILGFISRSTLVSRAERERKTLVEKFPQSPEAKELSRIADIVYNHKLKYRRPTPMRDDEFFDFIRKG
ncbi:MAG: AAA family ATPase [Deltaproteobacteria bacterium]|nr:AAA family ATPase [Deltaproteobacteria bacterium]